MRFFADMGVSRRVVGWLRERGDDVVHAAERGLARAKDPEILAAARSETRVLLTFDLDFGEILAQSGDSIVSVVIFRLNNTSPRFMMDRLVTVLESTEASLLDGAIVVVEDMRHRVRRLPLGS